MSLSKEAKVPNLTKTSLSKAERSQLRKIGEPLFVNGNVYHLNKIEETKKNGLTM